MSRVGEHHTVMCERTPLRDVQNERSLLQQTPPTVKVSEKENVSSSSCITDSRAHLCSSETNTSGVNLTVQWLVCAGGEVEISNRSDLSHPDQSTHTTTTIVPHEDAERQHQEHPYSTHSQQGEPQDHASFTDLTFTSFTCPGGEVEIKGYDSTLHHDPLLHTGPTLHIPTPRSDHEECEEHTQLPIRHSEHPYCNTQTSQLTSGEEVKVDDVEKVEEVEEAGSTDHEYISISTNYTDVTFKSFTCPGGDVVISEEPLVNSVCPGGDVVISEEPLVNSVCPGGDVVISEEPLVNTVCPGGDVVISEEPLVNSVCPGGDVVISEEPLVNSVCPGGDVVISEEPLVNSVCPGGDVVISEEPLVNSVCPGGDVVISEEPLVNSVCPGGDVVISEEPLVNSVCPGGDVVISEEPLVNSVCPGGDVVISEEPLVNSVCPGGDVVISEEPLVNSVCPGGDVVISEEPLVNSVCPGGDVVISEEPLVKSVCPGGDVVISEEPLVNSVCPGRDVVISEEPLVNSVCPGGDVVISEEPLVNSVCPGGDVVISEEPLVNSVCPGGDVVISEEPLVNSVCPGGDVVISEEPLVNSVCLLTDSEVHDVQSDTFEEHTELPVRHSEHPYCNAQTSRPRSGNVEDGDDDVSVRHPSISKPSTDITSFTCPAGGASEELAGSLLAADTEVRNLLRETCEEHTELPSVRSQRSHHETLSPPSTTHSSLLHVPDHAGANVSTGHENQDTHTILLQDVNISQHSQSSPVRKMRDDDGEGEDVHGGRSDQLVSVEESSVSAVRNEGAHDKVQEKDLCLPSTTPDLLRNENAPCDCTAEEEFPGDPSRSQPGADGDPGNPPETSPRTHPELLPSQSADVQAQMKMWSHIVLSQTSTPKHSELWLPESPMAPPRLHSTALAAPPTTTPHRVKDFSTVGKGPLQDQLRKMGELLIAASGKISGPADAAPVQQHSACVWTTPSRTQERSTNTSTITDQKEEVQVSDAATSTDTDSLLWSMSRSNVECLSRSELEQKLISTLIMVEVLSQQLMSAQTLRDRRDPAPSSLRDRLVQTERTELSQTGPYRELYVSALERIRILEIDQETLQSLHQTMQHTSDSLVSIKSETEEALSSMKELKGIVTDDQEILSQQLGQMKVLLARCIDTLKKMEQKNKQCVKDRDNMKLHIEGALEEKSTVLRVLEQLRVHHTTQVSDLQRNLGSHKELTDALTHTYKELVELNRNHMDSVTETNTLLRKTLEDHTHLSAELHRAQQLLQRTYPVLHTLHHKASSALQQSIKHQEERDRAVEDREQMEQQLCGTHSSLQEAHQQIADLNTQITIMSSEMAVLREQLSEVEDERSQLQRKSTELSATISSTLASYTFLEQTLASETSNLQRSLHDVQQATERADSLQAALGVCERRVEEVEQMLEQRDHLISELSTETENQRLQLRRLTQVHTELCNTKEMSEFLQAENEMTRQQLVESEGMLRSHLQGLRERNLECEDLRVEIQHLREEKECVQQELVSTRDKARLMLLEQGEQLAQATLDTALLLQRVCALINITHTTQHHKSEDGTVQTDPPAVPQPSSSFLHSVINALTEEQPCDTAPPTVPVNCVQEEDLVENTGSRSSAFTRITPSEHSNTNNDAKCGTTLLEMFSSLGENVSELHYAIEQLKQHKDSEIHTLHKNICDLQGEMEAQNNIHAAEEAELKQQVGRLKGQVEKDAQVLQQKIKDEKTLRKLCSELEEKMEAAQKYRVENNELRREGAELRRELQQSQAEVQALRVELRSNGQSAASMKDLEDRIRLLREVEKLKASLLEVEESRSRLLERAKRHQMVHAMNQSKLERELHLLDDMIEAVRKALSSVPDVVSACPELQNLLWYLG